MRRIGKAWLLMLAPALLAQQQTSPLTDSPVVDFKGKIQKVQLVPGQGTPYLEVQTGGKTTKVILGSMRYLMDKDFNPKAGQEVSGKGYKVGEDVYAIQAELPAENKTLKLRDENGYPLWIRGQHGQGKKYGGGKR